MIAVYFFAVILFVLLAAVLVAPLLESRAESAPGSAPARRLAAAIEALRELEFDHETGKIETPDYERLRAELAREAIEARDAGAAVAAERGEGPSCAVCGAAVSAGANYCTRCGTPMGGAA